MLPLSLHLVQPLQIENANQELLIWTDNTACLYSLETEEVTLHILTESPTVPRPKMATVDPFDTSATFQAAPSPVNRFELVMNKHHLIERLYPIRLAD